MWYQILALFIWSSSFVAAKFSYEMFDPVLMVQVRLAIVAIIALPFFLKCWKRIDKSIKKQLWWLAFFNYTAVFLLQFIGLKYTSAASAVTMIGLEPLMVVFIGHFFFQDKAKLYHWIFGIGAFIGVFTLIAGGNESGQISVLGCMLVLLAGAVFAVVLRSTQNIVAIISAQNYTFISIVLGTITTIPFTLCLTNDWQIRFSWSGFLGILYLSIACSWIAFWLWNKGLNAIPANLSGVLIALEPIFGIFLSLVLLGEQISITSWIGIIIVISSTLGASLYPRFSAKKDKPIT